MAIVGCAGAPAHPRYPEAKRGDTVDAHGVPDPYRWLEAMESPETVAWVAAENALTDSVIHGLPTLDAFRTRIAELVKRRSVGTPSHHGTHYFWSYRDGEHDLPVIETATSLDQPGTILLDPNTLSEGGKFAFAGSSENGSGSLFAYAMAEGGGDWQVWHVRDVATATDLPDTFAGIKYYRPQLVPGGVYYSRFPTPAKGTELSESDHDCKVYFHRLGTPAAEDVVVYERPDHPSWQFRPERTEDDRHIVITIGDGEVGDSRQEQLAVLDVATNKLVMLHDTFDAEYQFIGDRGSLLYFLTNADAPNKRVAALDLEHPGTWLPVIAATTSALDDATLAGSSIITNELRDAHSALVQYDLHGVKQREIALPTVGSSFVATGGPNETEAFGFFSSFAYPGTPLRIDLATGVAKPWVGSHPFDVHFDPSAFETKQVFVTSKDGTKIPMFMTAKRGLAMDNTHSVLLTGYGFGGISLTPYFDAPMVAWLERGGVLALVNVRGGGEYGEKWHDGGKLANEQNKFDDFNAAAAWLADNHIATHARVGAIGTSGGGMLVGAAVVQHPELYGAMFPIAGVLDLLRFQLFGEGAGWQADLGHPDVPAELAWLVKISPLHNVKPAHYPAALVITADHDVRVAPLHSYKFAAALQAAQTGAAPILLRIDTDSGHGGGNAVSQEIAQNAEILAFAAKYLDLK